MKLNAMNCHYRFYTLDYFFETVSNLGFDACEIWTSPHHFKVDSSGFDDIEKLMKLSQKYGVKIVCVCPEQTNPKPNNIATRDPTHKQKVFQYFCNCIDVAKMTHANKLVITSGWAFLNEDYDDAYQRSVTMMRRIAHYALKQGVNLALEALQPDESVLVNTIDQIKSYRKAVDVEALKVCIDMGAMARMGETLTQYFEAFGKDIIHIHFVDGNPTGHLAWGDGCRNMKEDLREIVKYNYGGHLSLENATSRYFMDPGLADKKSVENYRMVGGK